MKAGWLESHRCKRGPKYIECRVAGYGASGRGRDKEEEKLSRKTLRRLASEANMGRGVMRHVGVRVLEGSTTGAVPRE